MAEKKKVSLTRGAANILTNMLQQGEWYGSAKYAFLAGEVLARVLPEPEETKQMSAEALKAYLQEMLALDFDARQLKACKACIQHFIEKKQLSPNRYLLDLMEKLEMTPGAEEE
jgi:hypothetical protein